MTDKVRELKQQLEQGVTRYMSGHEYEAYLKAASKFHAYSFNNIILILMQRPDATKVAGYNAWQKNFHRNVKKGEKGIRIFAPAPFKRKTEDGEEELIPAYKVAYVWDIAQTDGEDLPTIRADNLTGDVDRYVAMMDAIKAISPLPIELEGTGSSANGFCDFRHSRIVVQQGMSEAQTVKTAFHELAHSLVHSPEKLKTAQYDQSTCEVQAESIAYIVCNHFGLDTSDYSFPYVASWSTGKSLKELRQSQDTICKTAAEIIRGIDKAFET